MLHLNPFLQEAFDAVSNFIKPVNDALPLVNFSGDRRVVAAGYGADISRQRFDELDLACAEWVYDLNRKNLPASALDVGCGVGAQSLRLAALGAEVIAVDPVDQGQRNIFDAFEAARASEPPRDSIGFICADIRDLINRDISLTGTPFDVVYSQRMWSSIPYKDALKLLKQLNDDRFCSSNAVFFLSAIGLDSEIGASYPHYSRSVEDRFSEYHPDMREKHGVLEPECLYTKEELIQQFRHANFTEVASWVSEFGNPKIIAARTKDLEIIHKIQDFLLHKDNVPPARR